MAGSILAMIKYRFITKHRKGKWYTSLEEAQERACSIGAGFLDHLSGKFTPYRGTILEIGDSQTR